jgi:hypothetical protein
MRLPTLALAGITGMVGLIAGRMTRSQPEIAAPPRIATMCIPAPPVAIPAPRNEPALVDDTEADGGEDLGEVLAAAERHAAELRGDHNAIVGRVADKHTGEPLAGVIVEAVSQEVVIRQASTTDEHGGFELAGLPNNDLIDEQDEVTVSSLDATRIVQELDAGPHVIIDASYRKNIPIPGRTFEATFGAAAGKPGDSIEIRGCDTPMENTYVIDDSDEGDAVAFSFVDSM